MAYQWNERLPQDETSGAFNPFSYQHLHADKPGTYLEATPWTSNHYSSSTPYGDTIPQAVDRDTIVQQSNIDNGRTALSPVRFPNVPAVQSQPPVYDEVLDTITQSMAPPTSRRKKAPTLRSKGWEPVKDRIFELHITQNLPLSEVKEKVEREYKTIGFSAT